MVCRAGLFLILISEFRNNFGITGREWGKFESVFDDELTAQLSLC